MNPVAVPRPRVRLANGTTVDVVIGGQTGALTVGRDQNGVPCLLQLRVGAHGSAMAGLTDALATAVTVGLQHGVPPTALADALRRLDLGSGDDHPDPLAETFTSVSAAGAVDSAGR